MFSFLQLTQNEWLKLVKKKSFYIAFLIMTIVPLGLAFVITTFIEDSGMYLTSFMHSVIDMNGGGSIYVFLCLIYMASLVSGEHQQGTIKFLLIRAHSRSKILASKYVTMIYYLLALMVFILIVSGIIGAIFFPLEGEGTWIDVLKSAGYTLIYTLIYSTIVFMFSVLTKSTGATIGIAFILVFIEDIFILLLNRYEFAKYLLFFNTNLQMYENGTPIIEGMTPMFSVAVILVYLAVILAISFYVFRKRDVS